LHRAGEGVVEYSCPFRILTPGTFSAAGLGPLRVKVVKAVKGWCPAPSSPSPLSSILFSLQRKKSLHSLHRLHYLHLSLEISGFAW
jgi:hypothetical protein